MGTILSVPETASAGDSYACWPVWVTVDGRARQVVRCRINGSIYQDFPGEDAVPVTLVYKLGTDATGECWYRGTPPSQFSVTGLYANGDADLIYDPGEPGGGFIPVGRVRQCDSEPVEGSDFEILFSIIEDFTFDDPEPSFNPAIGITGLETFVEDVPPAPRSESVVSPLTGVAIQVAIEVIIVEVDWGDGSLPETVPSVAFGELEGYPYGTVTHVYETIGYYDIVMSYEWSVQWRIGGGPWQSIVIDPTTTTTNYRVDQIVSRNTG